MAETSEVVAAADAMRQKRQELIAQPLDHIYVQLARAGLEAATKMRDQLRLEGDDDDKQSCERCDKASDIENMAMMDGCWFCAECLTEFQTQFDACAHAWEPHTDTMGDDGQYCSKCTGFVRNEDLSCIAFAKS